jgi:hypothetical protein
MTGVPYDEQAGVILEDEEERWTLNNAKQKSNDTKAKS